MKTFVVKESEIYYDSGGNLHITIYEDISNPTKVVIPNPKNKMNVETLKEINYKENNNDYSKRLSRSRKVYFCKNIT